MSASFWGYQRENGTAGVRNVIAIIPSVFCAARVAQCISQNVPGTVPFSHPLGCSQVGDDLEITARTLIGIGSNPNFAGVVVVGLGCERFTARELAEGIGSSGKRVEMVIIQEEGDSVGAIAKGTRWARQMQQAASEERRRETSAALLTIGLNCGASDMTSGLIANPALGLASDRLVSQGGSSILTELTELIGTEHILARRAQDEQVAAAILTAIGATEAQLKRQIGKARHEKRKHLISTGNYDGGISSVVEKALGGMKKSGDAPFVEVFSYGQAPLRRGLSLMDGPGHDGEASTGQVAAGAQIICFPTGRGTPTGFPGVPVIKITGNALTYSRMKENIDLDLSAVMTGDFSLREAGEKVYREILAVASGKLCKAEILGHHEQFCITRLA
jgi:altronate dehydratase large subunit